MTSKEKKAFPLTKKARQKRNTYAFAYANRALSDDDGASSPINLLHRASIAGMVFIYFKVLSFYYNFLSF